ncbi:hypothetical protein [Rickettsiales endosymbiont of Stachyamoeba lipophora]|uniref:hypothetical protein n=1 Tax=Rickettsiales endosymbiont of Stachyamoeba lipophora TaxID=2486578 RepID=UPI000F645BCA|nr:hypothetical protein [Rickettsiales endosymbiont of Stachyamoeba lipophora]
MLNINCLIEFTYTYNLSDSIGRAIFDYLSEYHEVLDINFVDKCFKITAWMQEVDWRLGMLPVLK